MDRNIGDIVGNIDGNSVIYVREKDVLFCKNTTIPFPVISRIIFKSKLDINRIPEKDLTITKQGVWINMGCLKTTIENCKSIEKEVLKIKNSDRKRKV